MVIRTICEHVLNKLGIKTLETLDMSEDLRVVSAELDQLMSTISKAEAQAEEIRWRISCLCAEHTITKSTTQEETHFSANTMC